MARAGRRWIIGYLYAYSKAESTKDLKVAVEQVKGGLVVEAGSVNSSRQTDESRTGWKLGQAGVTADEGRTMESSTGCLEQLCLVGLTDIEFAPQVVLPPAASSQPMGSQLDIGLGW